MLKKNKFMIAIFLMLYISLQLIHPLNQPDPLKLDKALFEKINKIENKKAKTFFISLFKEHEQNTIDTIILYKNNTFYKKQLSPEMIIQLSKKSRIKKLYLNKRYKLSRSESLPLIKLPEVNNKYPNLNGTGVNISVLDTGIDKNHIELQNKVILEQNFCDGMEKCNDTLDYNGHGTHIAGVIAGTNGIAPESRLFNYKVFYYDNNESDYTADSYDIAVAINTSITNHAHIISMSLGGDSTNNYCDDDFLAYHVNNAVNQGVIVVIATGNDGYSTNISYPSCASKSISVASSNGTIISSFSNRGSNFSHILLAPGESITSTYSCNAAGNCPTNNNYATMSGTSMATPHVSGSIALIIQAYKLKYNKTPTRDYIFNLLNNHGLNIYDSSSQKNYTFINIFNSIDYLIHPYLNTSYNNITTNTTNIAILNNNYILFNISSKEIVNITWSNNSIIKQDLNTLNSTLIYHINTTNHTLNITANLSKTDFDITTWHITILNPPQINKTQLNQTYTIYENQTFILKINATDLDNETLTFSDNSTLFNISQDGLINFTPSFFDSGNYSILIEVEDPEGYKDNYTFILEIKNNPAPPKAENLSYNNNISYNQTLYINYTIIDLDNNLNSTKIYKNNTIIYINTNITNNSFITYNEILNYTNKTSINYTIQITDNDNQTYIKNITIHYNYYHPPEINKIQLNQTYMVYENQTFILKINATDLDNETLTFSDNSTLFNISRDGLINFTPSFFDAGNYSILIEVIDPEGYKDNYTFTLIILNKNQPPEFINLPRNITLETNQLHQIDLKNYIIDKDNDTLILTTNNSEINVSNLTLIFFSNKTENISLILYLNDSKNTTNTTFLIILTPDKTPPVLKITSPEPKTYYTNTIPFHYTSSEKLNSCKVYLNNNYHSTCSISELNLNYNTYTLKIIAKDIYNNSADVEMKFTIERKIYSLSSSTSSIILTNTSITNTNINMTSNITSNILNSSNTTTNVKQNKINTFKTQNNKNNKKPTLNQNKKEINITKPKVPGNKTIYIRKKTSSNSVVISFFKKIISLIEKIFSFIF